MTQKWGSFSVLLLGIWMCTAVLLPVVSWAAEASEAPGSPLLETLRPAEGPRCAAEVPAVCEPFRNLTGGETPPVGGLRVYLDPQTGELTERPTPQQAAAFAAAVPEDASLARSDAGLVIEIRADGTKVVNLQGRFQSQATVRRGSGGSLAMACGHAPMSNGGAPAAPAPAGEER